MSEELVTQTELEKIKTWLETYTGFPNGYQVDFTSDCPPNGGIFPSGMVEVSRRRDVLGNVTVENQLNFGIYWVFSKSPWDDEGSTFNAEFVMDFQRWVQEQSATGQAPTFGDRPRRERIIASNGALYAADEEGTGTYMVQLSVNYVKEY